jgi:K+/H+ antiporter YhaU regulatory subunit KhtT
MFNLVTNVQTEQIGQLREMTTVLKSLSDTTREVAGVSSDVKDIKVSSANTEKNSEIILNTLADILEYVRRTEKCNHVILEKVNLLEKSLMLSERNDQTND